MLNKVLCIDDDPITLMLCKKVIERINYTKEINTALNGEEAINYFNEIKDNELTPPDLVLIDLNMPIMNGWEFLDCYLDLKYNLVYKDTKFIILSSTIDPNDIEKSKNYPMVVDFISKPITTDILLQIKL